MTGFSDLEVFLGGFWGFSTKYNRYNPIRKLPINIYFISSTLVINILISTKNPPIRWYFQLFLVAFQCGFTIQYLYLVHFPISHIQTLHTIRVPIASIKYSIIDSSMLMEVLSNDIYRLPYSLLIPRLSLL